MPHAPKHPKIYHIVHLDKLPSIVADAYVWSDSAMVDRPGTGTTIGMSAIKERRLGLAIGCHPGLRVGECVPFYFCPRSVMLYVIHCANHPDLNFRGGQGPIVHLEADLNATVRWANESGRRWAFTLSNAGARYFEDRCDLGELDEINWEAVRATQWSGRGVSSLIKEGRQAEFLVEECFPWSLVERIGTYSESVAQTMQAAVSRGDHRPCLEVRRDWYY